MRTKGFTGSRNEPPGAVSSVWAPAPFKATAMAEQAYHAPRNTPSRSVTLASFWHICEMLSLSQLVRNTQPIARAGTILHMIWLIGQFQQSARPVVCCPSYILFGRRESCFGRPKSASQKHLAPASHTKRGMPSSLGGSIIDYCVF